MKVAFLIDKNVFYRMFAPIIEEMLSREHDVYCFHDAACPRDGIKGYLYPALSDAPKFYNGNPIVVFYSGAIGFAEISKRLGIEVVVSLNYYNRHVPLHELVGCFGVKWVAIQYALDQLPYSHLIDFPDRFFFFSSVWFELVRTFKQPNMKLLTGDGVRFCGFPELDQLNTIDPIQVRSELGIPEGKPVVLYLSFQYLMQGNQLYSRYLFSENNLIMKLIACLRHPKYFKYLLRGYNNENLFKAIKKFCDRNNAYLLINGRQKSPIPPYIVGDKTVTDVSFYPADILKCLSVADVCFSFWSTVVTECVPMGVANVCIAPELDDIFPHHNRFGHNDSIFNHVLNMCPDLFDCDGVTRKMGIKELIRDLPDMSLDEFDINPMIQALWIQKFLSSADSKSSERIVSEIETLF